MASMACFVGRHVRLRRATLAVAIVAACTAGVGVTSSADARDDLAGDLDGRPETGVPTTDQMMRWIETLVAAGIRRPGYVGDALATLWIAHQLQAMGLDDAHLEPIQVERWRAGRCRLDVRIDGAPSRVPCFPVPYSTARPVAGEVALDTFDLSGDASALAGKIALYPNPHLPASTALLRDLVATRSYDPEGEFDTLVYRLPFGPRIQDVMGPAEAAGALGWIGIVGQSWESNRYYAPYDARTRGLPGVWVSPSAGEPLLQAVRQGRPVEASLSYRARQKTVRSHNVIASLPGVSDEWVIIGTHHDAPWLGAVEDASGVALVLAQARYWARVPREERPFHMLFLVNGGHMSGGAGIADFVESHRDVIDRSVVAIHLEHVAREPEVVNGRLAPGARPTPRWWFTSRIEPLEDAVEGVLQAEDLRRSLVLPPDAFFDNPPTDGAFLYPTGVPIVQLLAAPEYLLDIGDTPRMVHEESLVPITRGVIRLIEALSRWDSKSLRALDRRSP